MIARLSRSRSLVLALSVFLGGVFAYAAIHKIQYPPGFAKEIMAYRMLPASLVNLKAIYLPWLELLLGAALALGVWRRSAARFAAALLVVFLAAIGIRGMRDGWDFRCGCFEEGPSVLDRVPVVGPAYKFFFSSGDAKVTFTRDLALLWMAVVVARGSLARRDLGSRVVLVTGASSGIGRAVVLAALRRGHRVSGSARRADRLEELMREAGALGAGERLHVQAADVRNDGDMDAWVAQALLRFGRIDAVVHNAGYGVAGPAQALDLGDWRAQLETNFFAVVGLTKKLLPHLARNGDGDVILVSSILGLVSLAGRGPYCASKGALEAYARALRGEVAGQGVRVSVVNPGYTASEFRLHLTLKGAPAPGPDPGGLMTSEAVAEEIADCLGVTRRNVPLTALGQAAVWAERLCPALIAWVGRFQFERERRGP